MGGGRRWTWVKGQTPRAEGSAAAESAPLLVGHRRVDGYLVDGIVADGPTHGQGLLQVDDVGQGGGHGGRPRSRGGQAPERFQPGPDELSVGLVRRAIGYLEAGGLPVA